MNQKERMYQLAKAISALQEAVYRTDTTFLDMDSTKYDNILFEAHIKAMEALEFAKEALEIEFYQGVED